MEQSVSLTRTWSAAASADPARPGGRSGFTLIEVVAVLLVLGILAAVVVSRAVSSDNELLAARDVVRAHLRYAQERAMNSNAAWSIQFTGTTYTLYRGNTAQTLPGEDNAAVNPGVGISWSGDAGGIFSFDGWGRPCSDASASTLLASGRTITLTGTSASAVITVTPNTGFIP